MPYWRLFYHFVWATHQRLPLILPEARSDLYSVIAAKCSELGGIVHAVGGVADHVHLVVSVPPKLALAGFIGQVKGSSSHFMTHERAQDFAWQGEYGVVSCGERQLGYVARYVQDQPRHHADRTLIAELESTA
jgi:putative transposase